MILCIPTLIPGISTVIPCISRITTLIHPNLTLIPRVSSLIHRVPIIPLIPFPDSPFWLLQIALPLTLKRWKLAR